MVIEEEVLFISIIVSTDGERIVTKPKRIKPDEMK
jgi:hypothetical protein